MAKVKENRYVLSINTTMSSAFMGYFRNRVKAEQRAAYEKVAQRKIWHPQDGARVVVLDTVTNKLVYNMPVHRIEPYHQARISLNELRTIAYNTIRLKWNCMFNDSNCHEQWLSSVFTSPTGEISISIMVCFFGPRSSTRKGQMKSISLQWRGTGSTCELTRPDLERLVKDFESGNFR